MKSKASYQNNQPSESQVLHDSINGRFSSSEIVSMFGSIDVANGIKQDSIDTTTNKDDESDSAENSYPSASKKCVAIASDFMQLAKFKAHHQLGFIAERYVNRLFVANY